MLICIEGPSAVGKTSTCKLFEKNNNAYIVEETIFRQLNGCTLEEQAFFYLNKEIERWNLAQEKLISHPLVIFDSDPLKPLWFNWAFSFIDCLPLSELNTFFRNAINTGDLGYPDVYFMLTTSDQQLFRRKNDDKRRNRPEFEKLFFINESRKKYYNFLNELTPGIVNWIDAVDIKGNYDQISNIIHRGLPKKNFENEKYLSKTINWIDQNTL
jgi:thymidylate kinase